MVFRASVLVAALFLLALPASASATEPWPCLLVDDYETFATPVEGQPHDFDAGCSTDPDGHDLVLYEWDFDGDGTFETSSGASPAITHTFTGRGTFPDATVQFGWKVTDAAGESASYSFPLRITDTINSWFTYSPQLVNPGDELKLEAFTAHTNEDPLVTPIFTYTWDLDGDGVFETSSGLVPTTGFLAPDALGRHPVSLQVTDGLGSTSVVKRNIEILQRHPSRDQQPWNAPENLQDTKPIELTETEIREAVAPVSPEMPPVEPAAAPAPTAPQPLIRLRKLDGDKYGVNIVLRGPRWTRWHVVFRLPADRAASYGLPRKAVVFARGIMSFDGRGIAKKRMRWTKGAYRVFRKVRWSLVDIVPRRVR
ncbi:MAG TPA: PKD domain-containing protein [Solirubrobacteraceae bacterium]|jgi:hypothetical protein